MKNDRKINKYLNVFFIIAILSILISLAIIVVYSFLSRKLYVSVNDKNKNIIIEMLNNEGIINASNVTRIGEMQGLGDWYLYLEYDTGEEKSIILDDGDSRQLQKYIKNNGKPKETIVEIASRILILSLIYIPIYITYKICYTINKITEKSIQKNE